MTGQGEGPGTSVTANWRVRTSNRPAGIVRVVGPFLPARDRA